MGFVRRFSTFPSQQVISQIEGVVIVDQSPPASIQGVSTGVVGVIGEFADMRYAVNIDGQGNVTTRTRPIEVTSAQDLLNKVGGFDATLGDFGGDDGNGFVAVTNKPWARLVLAPVNLASSKGVRLWRSLPTNRAGSADPVKPMQAATVPAGFQFQVNSNTRVRLAQAVTFTADGALAAGMDGALADGGSAVEHSFTSATGLFVSRGVKVGDALVLGRIDTNAAAGTYRVVSIVSETALTYEKQDGTSFATVAATGLSWRIHDAATADTGGPTVLTDDAGYLLPARPLDAAVPAATTMAATAAAAAATARIWDPLSGLRMATMQAGVGLTYDADTQAPNAAQSDAMDGLYETALESLMADVAPVREVSIVFTARTSEVIAAALQQHVLTASATGIGRVATLSPPVSEKSRDVILGNEWPGVGATRSERVFYAWPGVQTRISEANGQRIKCADGTYTTSGRLDVRLDSYLASVLSNLATERNPGQALDPVPACLATILDFQRGLTTDFGMQDYILFRQYGVVALRFDRTTGKVFQSGVTSSLIPGQQNINRRRFADEVQDSLANAYAPLTKLPLTNQLKETINSSTISYLEGLLSANNPSAQRIEAYSVDSKSGNTPEMTAQGIHVVIARVRMLATSDDIVLQAEVGTTVNIATV